MNNLIEQSIIGALLMDPQTIQHTYERVQIEMFEDSLCREIYRELLQAYDTDREITLVELVQKLQSETYSAEYIGQELKDMISNAESYRIKGYVNALIAEYKTRRLQQVLSRTVPAAGVVDMQISQLLQELEAMKENDTVKIHTLSEIVDDVRGGYFTEPDIEPLCVGMPKLDDITGGLEGGDVIVIGARPAVGKSALVTQIALHLAGHKKKVAFYNLEMSEKQVYERLVSAVSGIGLTRIRRAHSFLGDEKERFDRANDELKQASLFIRSGPVSVSQIRNECKHLELDCIIIDYIQLLKSDVRYQSRVSEVGAISKAIKSLAMELNIPIIALSQLNRLSEARDNKEPTMGELREAGDIEQDASIILLMWNLVDDKKALKVEKNRQGVRNSIVLRFDGDNMKFIEIDETVKGAMNGFRKQEEPTPFD